MNLVNLVMGLPYQVALAKEAFKSLKFSIEGMCPHRPICLDITHFAISVQKQFVLELYATIVHKLKAYSLLENIPICRYQGKLDE